jgi:hypothetical protein
VERPVRRAEMAFRRELLELLSLVVFGLVVLWPALTAQFVLVDDHEILSLVPPRGALDGTVPQLDLRGMALVGDPSVGRFRPLYWTVRFGEIAAFGDNPHTWHALVLSLGIVSSTLLYGTARALGAGHLPSLFLAAWILVAPGVSSLWVRLGADDTVATVFLALSLFAAARAIRSPRSAIWDVLFVLSCLASTLSKEAFAMAIVAAGAFRVVVPIAAARKVRLRGIPIAGAIVLGVGIAATANAALIGASAGTLSYGGRYLALPEPANYARVVAQNSAILAFVGLLWLTPLTVWWLRRSALSSFERWVALSASSLTLVLVVPQILLYSQQGVFEGKYEAAAAIGIAAWSMAGLVLLKRRGLERPYRASMSLWCATLVAFGFGTWTYARYYAEDSIELNRLTDQVALSAAPGDAVGIAADPARQYEPIQSLVAHLRYRGRADLRVAVLPLTPNRPYSPLEASFATALANSSLAKPPLAEGACVRLGSMIVLGDESQTRAALPCLEQGFRRLVFSSSVLLWGGDSVSLRPRLPGIATVSYVLLLPAVPHT